MIMAHIIPFIAESARVLPQVPTTSHHIQHVQGVRPALQTLAAYVGSV